MGRRDTDARPPIEIVGADLGVSSTQQVALGPRRPKPSRGRSLAIALGVVVLLGVGLVLGGDDTEGTAPEEERDNQERVDLPKPQTSTTTRRTTTTTRPTTTTTTLPLGPILGEPVEGALLVLTGAVWTRVDLTTGEVSEIDLPPANEYDSVALAGGIALTTGDEVRFYPVLGAGATPEPVVLGPGDQVTSAGSDRVWIFDNPPESEESEPHVEVRLVDVTGRVLQSFQIPGRYGTWATRDAVLVSRGGRVYATNESGIWPIGTGWLMGAIGDAALVTACDDAGECVLQRQPTDGGRPRVLVEPVDPDTYFDSVEAPDGRVALLEFDQHGEQLRLLMFGPSGTPLGVHEPDVGTGRLPVFLPGDLGLLVMGAGGLQRLHEVEGTWRTEDLPSVHRGSIEALFVVTP